MHPLPPQTYSTMKQEAILKLSTQLLDGLKQVTETLRNLQEQLRTHARMLTPEHPEELEQATLSLLESSTLVEKQMRVPIRQMRLLARMLHLPQDATLKDVCATLSSTSSTANLASELQKAHYRLRQEVHILRQHMESLQFALRCIQDINEELLHLFHGAIRTSASYSYTPEGTTERAASPILDRTI